MRALNGSRRIGALAAMVAFVVLCAAPALGAGEGGAAGSGAVEDLLKKVQLAAPPDQKTPSSVTIPVSEYAQYQALAHDFQVLQENHRHLFTFGAMGAAVLCLFLVLLFIYRNPLPSRDSITLVGLVLVIFGVIILIQVVDSERQLTASMGVFGAIVGYLFGSVSNRQSSPEGGGSSGQGGQSDKSGGTSLPPSEGQVS